MARKKKKPHYNAEVIDQNLLDQVAAAYTNIMKCSTLDESSYHLIELVARDFDMSPMKMRKLLITAGAYQSDTSDRIIRLKNDGYSTEDIQRITGLSRSTVNGYLPYSKVIYKNIESSVGADRVKLLRQRRKACNTLQDSLSEEKLWECMVMYQGYKFYTASGLPFQYTIKIGRNGKYTREFIIDRRTESKTLTWSSILLAFDNAVKKQGEIITRPKDLGDIRGVSYIYPIFHRLGIIEVPESVSERIKNGK